MHWPHNTSQTVVFSDPSVIVELLFVNSCPFTGIGVTKPKSATLGVRVASRRMLCLEKLKCHKIISFIQIQLFFTMKV